MCFWEDDAVQLRWPDWAGGANKPCLIQAQSTYADLGACEARLTPHVRPATADQPIDPGWRPIDPARDSFEPLGVKEQPWPQDNTALYWWRPTFWRQPTGPSGRR